MKLCILPGTFNPIHEAHLAMANFAVNFYGFEKVIFIPAYIPPHKDISRNMATHRLQMVKLAVGHNSKFEVSDVEYELGKINNGKSYSLYTVKKIKEIYNIEGKVNFLIGTDAFEKIDSWYKANELKELVHFIVFPRGVELSEKQGYDFEMAPMECLDISSTKIRNNNNSMIKEIEGYVKQNGLYSRICN